MSDLIGPEEARQIQAALDQIRSEPPPTDSGPLGCLLALVAVVGLIELYPDGSSDSMLALSTRIIRNAHISTGPATTETFDFEEVAERLGPALPYVMRVERWLIEKKGEYPVFTSVEDGGGGGARKLSWLHAMDPSSALSPFCSS